MNGRTDVRVPMSPLLRHGLFWPMWGLASVAFFVGTLGHHVAIAWVSLAPFAMAAAIAIFTREERP